MHKYNTLDDSSVWVIPPNYDSRPEPETIFFCLGGVAGRPVPIGFFGVLLGTACHGHALDYTNAYALAYPSFHDLPSYLPSR